MLQKTIAVYENQDPTVRHIHINYGIEIEKSIKRIREQVKIAKPIADKISSRFLALKLLEKDQETLFSLSRYPNFGDIKQVTKAECARIELLYNDDSETIITDAKYGFIAGALKETYKQKLNEKESTSDRIDKILTHPLLGMPIFIFLMMATFYATFRLGTYPMGWIESLVARLGDTVRHLMQPGMLRDLLTNGIIDGTGSVLVFLPNILILFFFISLMEDSGYMARAAFIMDKLMHFLGLHGRSFIPMVMGFGCNVPAIMATRTLRNPGDRLLTMLIIPFMSCSARLPVYVLFISAFFPHSPALVLGGIYFTGIVLAFAVAQVFNRTFFRNKETPFVLELPPYRIPTFRNIVIHMWDKSYQYLRKIAGVILIGVVLVWALGYFPRHSANSDLVAKRISQIEIIDSVHNHELIDQLKIEQESIRLQQSYLGRIGQAIQPVMQPLGFDWKMSIALLAGLPAKEIVVSTLGVLYQVDAESSLSLEEKLKQEKFVSGERKGEAVISIPVALAFLIFVLIYFPCLGVIATIRNESGKTFWAIFTMVYTTGLAWLMAWLTVTISSAFIP